MRVVDYWQKLNPAEKAWLRAFNRSYRVKPQPQFVPLTFPLICPAEAEVNVILVDFMVKTQNVTSILR